MLTTLCLVAPLWQGHSRKADILVTVVRDLPYGLAPSGAEFEKLNVYLPSRHELNTPTLLWIHGGGWSVAETNKDDCFNDLLCRQVAAYGIPVVSCNYYQSTFKPCRTPPAGSADWRKTIREIKTVIEWIRSSAGMSYALPSTIVIGGSSAGGHLAAMMAVTQGPGETEFDPHPGVDYGVSQAVLFSPSLDFIKMGCIGIPLTGSSYEGCLDCPSPIYPSCADPCTDLFYRGGPIPAGYPCANVAEDQTCYTSAYQEIFLGELWHPSVPPLWTQTYGPGGRVKLHLFDCDDAPTEPAMPTRNAWYDASPLFWVSGDEPDIHIYQARCDAWIPAYDGEDFRERFQRKNTQPSPPVCTVTTYEPQSSPTVDPCKRTGCQHAAEGIGGYDLVIGYKPHTASALIRDRIRAKFL